MPTAIGIGIGTPFQYAAGGGVPPNHLIAARGTFLFSGQAAGFLIAHKLSAAAGSFAFTGQDATLAIRNHRLAANAAAFTMTGQAATMTIGPAAGHFELNAQFGAFNYTGDTMTPVIDYRAVAASGSFAFSGQNALLRVSRTLTAAGASFTFSGQAATLTKSNLYAGPGDLVSGASWWVSCARAYSAAFAASGAAVMDLVDQANANPITINILSTGFVDVAAITAWQSANSVTTIKVKKLYDQTTNGRDFTQATLSQMPTLTLSAINGLPALTFASASAQRLDSPQTMTPTSSSGPMTFSAVAKRTSNFTTQQAVIGAQPGQSIGFGFSNSANTLSLNYISAQIFKNSVTDNAFHSINGVISGGSSVLDADNSSASGTLTGGAPGANQGFRLGRDNGGNLPLDGMITEAGGWLATAFNGTQITSVSANQHGTSGYNF